MPETNTETLEQVQNRAFAKFPVICIGERTTAARGVVRLEQWDTDEYVLWFHGQIVWKSWE